MYYAAGSPGAPPGAVSQEKSGNIFIPNQGSFAAHMNPGFPGAQQVMPNGMNPAARYTHAGPQAYAVVSTPGGHPAYAPGVYSSMPYATLGRIPASNQAYMSAAQYPGGIGYQTAALAAARTGPPPHYSLPTPVQAGAPLFAAGYTPMPSTMAGPGARSLPMGPVPTAAAAGYPPGYTFPGAATTEAAAGPIAYGYMPQM